MKQVTVVLQSTLDIPDVDWEVELERICNYELFDASEEVLVISVEQEEV